MRVRPIVLVFVVLSAARPAAANDPLPVPVQVTTERTGGSGDPGPLTLTFDPSGTLALTPDVPRTIGTATLGRGPGWTDLADSIAYTDYQVKVTVTDPAGGGTRTLGMQVEAYDEWDYRAWDGRMTELQQINVGGGWGSRGDSTAVTLNGWSYTLTGTPNDFGDGATFTLTAAPVHTPEPATLVLGAVALLPVGLRAVRRRAGANSN
jgi:hypothetical protein